MKSLNLKLSRRPRLFFSPKITKHFSHFQMSSNNIEKEVRQAVKDLMHIRSRVSPVKVGKDVVSSPGRYSFEKA